MRIPLIRNAVGGLRTPSGDWLVDRAVPPWCDSGRCLWRIRYVGTDPHVVSAVVRLGGSADEAESSAELWASSLADVRLHMEAAYEDVRDSRGPHPSRGSRSRRRRRG